MGLEDFLPGYRGGILQIFRQQFLSGILGLFLIAGLILGVIFIRNADYSLLKTLDFVFFSNVKARSALPVLSIFVASLASSFLFLLFCFLCGLSIWGSLLCSVGSVIPWIWHGNYSRISVCCLWIPRIFISFGCYFTGSIYLSDCHFNRFQRKHAVFQKDTSTGRKTEEQEAQPKNNVRHFFIRFSILTGILIIGALVDVLDHSLLFRLICILI
ncbi:MAG: hypothetical protein V8Q17_10025 [Acutalibacteraceae bacterium]